MTKKEFNELKVGYKVVINPNLVHGDNYQTHTYYDIMHFDGVGTIESIKTDIHGIRSVNIVGKPNWGYTHEMLNKAFIFGK